MATPVEVWAPAFLEYKSQKGLAFVPDKKNVKPEMLKNVDPATQDMAARPKFSLKYIGDPDKAFSSYDGRCNLCETHPTEGREKHLAKHVREASKWQAAQKIVVDSPE